MPSVTAIIVSHNSRPEIGRALASLEDVSRIIVVDNASDDDTTAFVRRHFPHVKLIALEENIGFGRAINLAARHTDTEFLLLLNPDAWLIDADLSSWTQCLMSHQAQAVGPIQQDETGTFQLSFGLFPSLWTESVRRFAQRCLDRRDLRASCLSALIRAWWGHPKSVAWIAGSAVFLRREDFSAIGGFDPRFFLFFEDIDLCLRLHHAGRKVIFSPYLRVGHSRGRSASRRPAIAQRAYRQSQRYWAGIHLGRFDAFVTRKWAAFRESRIG